MIVVVGCNIHLCHNNVITLRAHSFNVASINLDSLFKEGSKSRLKLIQKVSVNTSDMNLVGRSLASEHAAVPDGGPYALQMYTCKGLF